ncbi:MAG: alpha/beta hydrolase [Anaerovoracaceae bacterium]
MKNFVLKKTNEGELIGYLWPVDAPCCVVCLVHGIGEHAGRYDRMAGFFHEKNIALVSMDLRGHGKSMGKRGDCSPRSAVREDVSALIDYAKKTYPGVPVVLYGHSMGGNIVLDYRSQGEYNGALTAYVVSAPWITLVNKPSKPLYQVVKLLSKIMPKTQITSPVEEADLGNPISVGAYKADPLVHDKITARCAVEGFEIGEKLHLGCNEDNGRAKNIPMLLMHGDADKICSVEGSRALAAAEGELCQYLQWEGYFHEIHNGGGSHDGTEVILATIDFLLAVSA